LAALRAGSAFLVNATPSTRQTLTSIVPQMLNVLPPILGDPTKDVAATQALESLGELAAECSSVFHSTIPALIEFMTSIMRNTTLENAVRHFCSGATFNPSRNFPCCYAQEYNLMP
ncbi:hypothetical protein BASA81_011636, partial [Batrachochytrium salamandrivorans]